ncbi:MAG: cupin domain-containing protein [Acidobacteria bacterium]|nr:cupin domain-containing protein [Acidobacteriota bacterium]
MPKLSPRRVDKPWGFEEIFAFSERYVGKILFIRANEALSLQYHERKDETIRIESGEMDLIVGSGVGKLERLRMGPGDAYHITPGTIHRMIAVSDCTLFEVSTPELDDVVRLEDRYGREGTSAP